MCTSMQSRPLAHFSKRPSKSERHSGSKGTQVYGPVQLLLAGQPSVRMMLIGSRHDTSNTAEFSPNTLDMSCSGVSHQHRGNSCPRCDRDMAHRLAWAKPQHYGCCRRCYSDGVRGDWRASVVAPSATAVAQIGATSCGECPNRLGWLNGSRVTGAPRRSYSRPVGRAN